MTPKETHNTNQVDQPAEVNALMAAYNPEPPHAAQPARFYWQEPWHETTTDEAVQAAFEN